MEADFSNRDKKLLNNVTDSFLGKMKYKFENIKKFSLVDKAKLFFRWDYIIFGKEELWKREKLKMD